MPITKQEFYEGAALHKLARNGRITSLSYEAPLFTINGSLLACLKYSTRNRTPWGFTFTVDEQTTLRDRGKHDPLVIGLVCGSDGIVALPYKSFYPRLRNKVEKWENEKFNICLTIVLRACYTESVSKKS